MLGIQGEHHSIKSLQQPLATQPGIVNKIYHVQN